MLLKTMFQKPDLSTKITKLYHLGKILEICVVHQSAQLKCIVINTTRSGDVPLFSPQLTSESLDCHLQVGGGTNQFPVAFEGDQNLQRVNYIIQKAVSKQTFELASKMLILTYTLAWRRDVQRHNTTVAMTAIDKQTILP